jgi:hypothetical protein
MVFPLKVDNWAQELHLHPDQSFYRYIIQGLQEGFRVGFNYSNNQLRSKGCNIMLSATKHPQEVDVYLMQEKSLG